MNRATGAITVMSAGSDSSVTMRNTKSVWPLPVSRSSSFSNCVIQMTAVSPSRQARNAPAVIRRI